MTLQEKVYLGLAMYSVLCTTVNCYFLLYLINYIRELRKSDIAKREMSRIERENFRRENYQIATEMRQLYYDILGGKYNAKK